MATARRTTSSSRKAPTTRRTSSSRTIQELDRRLYETTHELSVARGDAQMLRNAARRDAQAILWLAGVVVVYALLIVYVAGKKRGG